MLRRPNFQLVIASLSCALFALFPNTCAQAAPDEPNPAETDYESAWGDDAWRMLESLLDHVDEDTEKTAYGYRRFDKQSGELKSEFIQLAGRSYRSSEFFCRNYIFEARRPAKHCGRDVCEATSEEGYEFDVRPMIRRDTEGGCAYYPPYSELSEDMSDDDLIHLYRALETVWRDMHAAAGARTEQPFLNLAEQNAAIISKLNGNDCFAADQSEFTPRFIKSTTYFGDDRWLAGFADFCSGSSDTEYFIVRGLFDRKYEVIAYQIILDADELPPLPW